MYWIKDMIVSAAENIKPGRTATKEANTESPVKRSIPCIRQQAALEKSQRQALEARVKGQMEHTNGKCRKAGIESDGMLRKEP
jgi:hypothetical protein